MNIRFDGYLLKNKITTINCLHKKLNKTTCINTVYNTVEMEFAKMQDYAL